MHVHSLNTLSNKDELLLTIKKTLQKDGLLETEESITSQMFDQHIEDRGIDKVLRGLDPSKFINDDIGAVLSEKISESLRGPKVQTFELEKPPLLTDFEAGMALQVYEFIESLKE